MRIGTNSIGYRAGLISVLWRGRIRLVWREIECRLLRLLLPSVYCGLRAGTGEKSYHLVKDTRQKPHLLRSTVSQQGII